MPGSSRVRELLDRWQFDNLVEAPVVIEDWRLTMTSTSVFAQACTTDTSQYSYSAWTIRGARSLPWDVEQRADLDSWAERRCQAEEEEEEEEMSESSTSAGARVVKVAAGRESTDRQVPVRDMRHEALGVLIGKWINEGHTIASPEVPSAPILTSDVYEWAPGGFFVVHSAYGRIGASSVGGVEIIGVTDDAYSSTFCDSFGNVHTSRVEIDGDVIRWLGERTRCTATITDRGMTQVAHHESSPDGVAWSASMEVTLRKIA
jgi:hypothetical protein